MARPKSVQPVQPTQEDTPPIKYAIALHTKDGLWTADMLTIDGLEVKVVESTLPTVKVSAMAQATQWLDIVTAGM